jgi:hypothetical protein
MATVCEWFDHKTTRTVFAGLISKSVATVSSNLFSKPAATVSGGLASNPIATVSSGLASMPDATVSDGLASKPVAMISQFRPQNRQVRFGDLGLKITTTVSWFVPQNQADFGLSVVLQNR